MYILCVKGIATELSKDKMNYHFSTDITVIVIYVGALGDLVVILKWKLT